MKRYKHSLSHYHLTTGQMGKLYPVGVYEVLPGDTIQQHTSALIRLSPPARPVMHPVVVRFHTWYVPYRLVWEDFQNFITGGSDGEGDGAVYPTITAHATNGFTAKTLPDYFGIRPGSGAASLVVSALPIRAYNMIWNMRYRDQDLQTELTVPVASGADTTSPLTVQNVSWEKDRFTAARPWPQKGPDVSIPLGVSAPVKTSGSALVTGANPVLKFSEIDGTAPSAATLALTGAGGLETTAVSTPSNDAQLYPNNLFADLTGATAATVTDLQYAVGLQKYAEARALYGSEYIDYLRYLGIKPSDARLQQPEYLGGAKQTVAWGEVLNTADDLGGIGGHGITAMRTRPYRHFFEEHGVCITLMSVRPRSMYGESLERMWSRNTKEDFWQKELERVGQEAIYSREVYAESDANGGSDVFGFGDRYSDYRGIRSRISGEFRDSTLYDWHLARLLGSQPSLNSAFIKCEPSNRIFVDQTANADHLWCMVNHRIAARRFVGHPGVSRMG